jgi:NAD(P)-dependent dehydrogenase (short-subunit alcohol dehydrogenase family)
MGFKDWVTLVTGGTSGIGRATALLFGREGASVAVVGRDQERGQRVVDEIGDIGAKAVFLACDVRIPEHCRHAVEETLSILGGLDVLVNNAGVFYANSIVDCTEEEWDETLDVSLKGTFLMSKYALPQMIEKGHGAIVNVASGWGLVGGNEAAAYCAPKASVLTASAPATSTRQCSSTTRSGVVWPGPTIWPKRPTGPCSVSASRRRWPAPSCFLHLTPPRS